MKEQQFDFFEKWNREESLRFLEALKRKKIEFCKEYGLPVPAFDKEEDFFVTSEMIAWAQGEEKPNMMAPCPFGGGPAKWGSEKREDAVFIYCESGGCSTKSVPRLIKDGNGFKSQPHELIARRLWNARCQR